MYIHYYLDSQLKVSKITGNVRTIDAPPILPLGYSIYKSAPHLAEKIDQLIDKGHVHDADFSNETPIYNLGNFEDFVNQKTSYFKLLHLNGSNEQGIVYLLEYSPNPDIFTLDLIDHEVIESIEISRFRDIVKISSIGVLQVDEQWRTLYASKTWSEMTGYSLTEVAGREWTQTIHPQDKNHFLEKLHHHSRIEKNSEQDIRIITAQGAVKWYNVHYRISYDNLNDCTSIILLFLDVHNKRQRQNYLKKIATTDGLTKLGNRYAFQEALEKFIRQLHSNQTFNLLFMDLDGFKPVNDAYGHLIGDKLLSETAKRIAVTVGQNSFVARLGGDEFAILRPESNEPKIEEFAADLLQRIAKPYSLLDKGHESYISASIGIVTVKTSDISYFETTKAEKVTEFSTKLLRKADAAMYHAKEVGKNTYRFYAGSIDQATIKTQILNDALHKALEQQEFKLHYQPQYNVDSNELYGYEALIRWQQHSKEVSPGLFIPLVESNGLMNQLGRWVFEKALQDHSKLLTKMDFTPQLSVNFSPIQFRDHKLCPFIENSLEKYNIPPQSVTIEITESLLISDQIQVKKQLECLNKLGLKIALDDFGTGYSSLSNLHTFPIDIIKIDQSFTKNLELHDTRQIVRAIIKMSNELNKTILFEGVETTKQLDFLKNEGVKLIQGWLISKAVPPENLTLFAEKKEVECLS